MCLILTGLVKNLLKCDLERAERMNPHGFGVYCKGEVITSFDNPLMTSREVIASMTGNVSVHYRYTTHGLSIRENAHPFSLGNGLWLMHNGILDGDQFDCPHNYQSDTAILAEKLQGYRIDQCKFVLELLSQTSWSKFLLLSDKGIKLPIGNWAKTDGAVWHSNAGILKPATRFAF